MLELTFRTHFPGAMRVLEVPPEAKPELALEHHARGRRPFSLLCLWFLTRVGPFASLDATCKCQRPGGAGLPHHRPFLRGLAGPPVSAHHESCPASCPPLLSH